MVIDALLLCFVADDQENDGTDGKPYYASDRLRVSVPYFMALIPNHIMLVTNKRKFFVSPATKSRRET